LSEVKVMIVGGALQSDYK